MAENIGGISVSISIDLNDFQAQLDQAVSMAQSSGASIGAAFGSGSTQVQGLNADLTLTNNVLGGIWATLSNLRQNMVSSLDAIRTSTESVNSSTQQVNTSINTLATSMQGLGNNSRQASEGVGDLGRVFGGLTGIQLSMVGLAVAVADLGKNAIEAFADLDRATVSLTALTGSATQAQTEISGLERLAQDEALSFPELLQANQRLTALGVSATQIPAVLKAAADGAAAMNTSLINVTNAIDRMAASGSVAGRNLTQLGLTTNDLAAVMGVSLGQLSKAFHYLDEDDRIQVLS